MRRRTVRRTTKPVTARRRSSKKERWKGLLPRHGRRSTHASTRAGRGGRDGEATADGAGGHRERRSLSRASGGLSRIVGFEPSNPAIRIAPICFPHTGLISPTHGENQLLLLSLPARVVHKHRVQ